MSHVCLWHWNRRLDLTFPYVPTHLHYIMLELLKNSMRVCSLLIKICAGCLPRFICVYTMLKDDLSSMRDIMTHYRQQLTGMVLMRTILRLRL